MLRFLRIPALALAALTFATPAHADLTGFVGVNTAPSNRPLTGVSAGVSLIIVGFEAEYARTYEDLEQQAPALTTGMGNVFVQTPVAISGLQFYGTIGGGFYRESLAGTSETNIGSNAGGGVKITLAGPLRLRLDYRIFTLAGNPRHSRPQRLYAGLNLAF